MTCARMSKRPQGLAASDRNVRLSGPSTSLKMSYSRNPSSCLQSTLVGRPVHALTGFSIIAAARPLICTVPLAFMARIFSIQRPGLVAVSATADRVVSVKGWQSAVSGLGSRPLWAYSTFFPYVGKFSLDQLQDDIEAQQSRIRSFLLLQGLCPRRIFSYRCRRSPTRTPICTVIRCRLTLPGRGNRIAFAPEDVERVKTSMQTRFGDLP